ncbi:helix-turn-helix domain-containing protein [Saprospiraceae bacterium]|nr:helix-turn-helix domain-containing protein [Saprospiraceae bacterium]
MLKEYIKAKGVKQKWIADKIGVSEVTLSNWVKMKTTPSDENMEKLSKVLDLDISDIAKLYGR